jgi:hypothetical protein
VNLIAENPLFLAGHAPVWTLRLRLAPLSASDLGSHAIRAALGRAGVAPKQIEAVIVGQVIRAARLVSVTVECGNLRLSIRTLTTCAEIEAWPVGGIATHPGKLPDLSNRYAKMLISLQVQCSSSSLMISDVEPVCPKAGKMRVALLR